PALRPATAKDNGADTMPLQLPGGWAGPQKDGAAGQPISRAEVLTRAVTWVLQAVPYNQGRFWTDQNGRYRQDCSGFVSMAWHLDPHVNYWTANLAKVSTRIP